MSLINGFYNPGFSWKIKITGAIKTSTVYFTDGDRTLSFIFPMSDEFVYCLPSSGQWICYQQFRGITSEGVTINIPSDTSVHLKGISGFNFSTLTLNEIQELAPFALNLWTAGEINNNVVYGSYTGIQLYHCLTENQKGKELYNTTGNIVIGFVNTIESSNTSDIYFSGNLHTMCNTTIYNNLQSEFKSMLKPWTCWVGKENTTERAGAYGTYSQTVYLAAPSAKEIGSSNGYNSDENNKCFCFDYFVNADNTKRQKNGTNALWRLRSPSYTAPYNGPIPYYINADGSMRFIDYEYKYAGTVLGVSPIGCI